MRVRVLPEPARPSSSVFAIGVHPERGSYGSGGTGGWRDGDAPRATASGAVAIDAPPSPPAYTPAVRPHLHDERNRQAERMRSGTIPARRGAPRVIRSGHNSRLQFSEFLEAPERRTVPGNRISRPPLPPVVDERLACLVKYPLVKFNDHVRRPVEGVGPTLIQASSSAVLEQ